MSYDETHEDRGGTPARQFQDEIFRQELGNQVALIKQQLNQLFSALPDRASVEVSKQNITTVMEAMVRVASKDNMLVISDRLGKLEVMMESTSRTSAFNEKDVAQLKDGQSSIRETLFREIERLQSSLKEQTSALNETFGQQTRDLKSDLDVQTTDLRSELGKQTDQLKNGLNDQTTELVRQIYELKLDFEKSRNANATWLLATILVIIGTVVAVSMFFARIQTDRAPTGTPPSISSSNTGAK